MNEKEIANRINILSTQQLKLTYLCGSFHPEAHEVIMPFHLMSCKMFLYMLMMIIIVQVDAPGDDIVVPHDEPMQ